MSVSSGPIGASLTQEILSSLGLANKVLAVGTSETYLFHSAVIALVLHLSNQCSTTEPQNPAPTIEFNVSSQGPGDVGEEEGRDNTGEIAQRGERLDDLSLVPRTPWKQITSLGVLRLSSDLPCTHNK